VGLSLETAQRLGHDFWISSEIHMNAVAMSANENIFLREESEKRNYDFGLGEGTKIFIVAAQPRLGSLRLEYVAYGLNSISTALDTDHLGVGLAYSFYHKDAFYDSYSDVHESMHSVMLYMKIL
jgi:hypothetical protein